MTMLIRIAQIFDSKFSVLNSNFFFLYMLEFVEFLGKEKKLPTSTFGHSVLKMEGSSAKKCGQLYSHVFDQ